MIYMDNINEWDLYGQSQPIDLDLAWKHWAELIEEDKSLEEFFNHPINVIDVNDDLLNSEIFQAIQSLQEIGSVDERAINLINHAQCEFEKVSKEDPSEKEKIK